MDSIVGWLAGYIADFILAAGYLGIAICMALESCNIPVPSELVLTFAGYHASADRFTLAGVIVAGTIGQTFGSLISYYIGRYAMDSRLLFWVSQSKKDKLRRWFDKYGESTAFFSRLMPGVRTFISLPAGAGNMPLGKFLLYSAAGCLIWSTILAYLGYATGENWQSLEKYFEYLDVTVGLGLVAFVAIYLWQRRRASR